MTTDSNDNEYTDDESYIKDLEGMVCFLAQTYETLRETYFMSHMKTCDITNPNRRELTDAEQSEWMRFSMIQGSKLQNIVKHFADANKPIISDMDKLLNKYKINK